MQRLDREKLTDLLGKRRLNLRLLAQKAGISRQSLYSLLKGGTIYNQPFLKLVTWLNLDPEAITSRDDPVRCLTRSAPERIQKVMLRLEEFVRNHDASLCLFGSRARGRKETGLDWDFGIYFHNKNQDGELRKLKRALEERAFPYQIDVVNLNGAPPWFLQGILGEALVLVGDLQDCWRRAA